MTRDAGKKRHSIERLLLGTMAAILSRKRHGKAIPPDSLRIVPFLGYGTRTGLHFRGRVIERSGLVRMHRGDLFIQNAYKMWRRFLSRPGRDVKVRVRAGSACRIVTTNEQGFFHVDLNMIRPSPHDLFSNVDVEVVEPKTGNPVQTTGTVFIPPGDSRFGVISDVDDTIIYAHATNPFKMIRLLLFSNASTRLPFPGVRAFYRAMHEGPTGRERNPFFYISSSSWQMYDVLQDFMKIHAMPPGPIFLRELPCAGSIRDPWHHGYKLKRVRGILELYPDLPFVLIGDSGQRDAELYSLIVRSFPGRIPVLYIRDVLPTPLRRHKIAEIADKVRNFGSELLLIEDTMAAARDGVDRGWISQGRLPEIERDRVEDERAVRRYSRFIAHSLKRSIHAGTAGEFRPSVSLNRRKPLKGCVQRLGVLTSIKSALRQRYFL